MFFLFLTGWTSAQSQTHNLITNLQYRNRSGDLGNVVPGPLTSLRGVRIEHGGEALLQNCLIHPEQWFRDPLLFRFGHKAPFTTTGCRERRTPSLHAVFYLQPDGSRQAWVHFDLRAPGDHIGHATEVIRNRLTLGHTSQADVYRSFLAHDTTAGVTAPPRTYDFGLHARDYLRSTFGPEFLTGAAFSSLGRTALDRVDILRDGTDGYGNHLAAKLVRHTLRQSIEFGTAAMVQQDERWQRSSDDRLGSRLRSAFIGTFWVPGHNGRELAFPRIAAAVGTGFIIANWHPWVQERQNPWVITSEILTRYVWLSLWHEFRPDITTAVKKRFKRE